MRSRFTDNRGIATVLVVVFVLLALMVVGILGTAVLPV